MRAGSGTEAPFCPAPDGNPRPARFAVPALACDCHVHVFGPADRYPYQANRAYTPHDAPPEQLFRMHATLGLSRAVLVQASAHGTDNRAILDGIARRPDSLRGVAAVTEDVTDAELNRLHDGGVRGIRINLVDKGGMPFRSLDSLVHMSERICDKRWHIEFLVHVEESDEFRRLLSRLAVPAIVGHAGYVRVGAGVDHPGYREFLALMRDGLCWAKLTGPYRISAREAPPYDDARPFAEAVLAAAPDRVVWGSDWPHVIHYRTMPNDGELLDALADWAPDEDLRRRVLVDNPARLYGFE